MSLHTDIMNLHFEIEQRHARHEAAELALAVETELELVKRERDEAIAALTPCLYAPVVTGQEPPLNNENCMQTTTNINITLVMSPKAGEEQQQEAISSEAQEAGSTALLDPRVIKQINIRMPETQHYELTAFIDSLPRTSMQKFIIEAIAEKMDRMREGTSV